ncbi:MAG TPA: alpha/beta hydrolase [Elusimicrobia bacterium]|nr:alpha/beta hydrolase [Elusimicrobiota bacterium]
MVRLLPLLLLAPLLGCTRLFFQPDRWLHHAPQVLKVRFEPVRFASADGTMLSGYWFPSTGTALGTVVHFHGNGQNVTSHYTLSYWLAAEGFNVFAFDYRGYGDSEGVPGMKGAVQDGAAALRWASEKPGVDAAKLAVFGQSLGAALGLAAIQESGLPVRAVVLEGSFLTYRSIGRAVLRKNVITWPFQWLPYLVVTGRRTPAEMVRRLPPCRLLFVHGEDDEIVPLSEGQRLFALAPEPKSFLRTPGGHLDAFSTYRSMYGAKLTAFLKEAMLP